MDLCKNCTFFTSCFVSGDPSRGRASRVGPEPDGGGREEAGTVNHDDCFFISNFYGQVQSTNSKGGPDARVTFETFLPLLQVKLNHCCVTNF